jgi:hypothetical protein
METQTILPEYRVSLGCEVFVTAQSPLQAHGIALRELTDRIRSDKSVETLFTAVVVEKMDDDEDEDDDEDDAPEDFPGKPKKPTKMRK